MQKSFSLNASIIFSNQNSSDDVIIVDITGV